MISNSVWERDDQRDKAFNLDPDKLYYSDRLPARGTTIFRTGVIEKGLIQLYVFFPKEEDLVCSVAHIHNFIPVDPEWLGGLYRGIMRSIDEYRRLVKKK